MNFDITTILGIALILGVTMFFYFKERKYTLLYKGRNQYGALVIIVIIALIISTLLRGKDIKPTDILVIIVILPLSVIGNKCGINENGVLLSTYLTPWEKIQEFSMVEESKRYVLIYRSNGMTRKVFFSKEIGKEADIYLSKNRKIRHRKK